MADPKAQKVLVAELLNRKREDLARQAVAREGQPYGTTDVSWQKVAEAWNERDPKVDEAQVWDQVLTKAAQALADDPDLHREDVLDEVPIEVARIVFPKREEIIKQLGGLNYEDWTKNAEQVEKIAARLRDEQEKSEPAQGQARPNALPAPTEAPPLTPPPLGSSGPPEPLPAVQPVTPTPPMPPPPVLPVGPGAPAAGVPMPAPPGLTSGTAPSPMLPSAAGQPRPLAGQQLMGG